MHGHQQHGHNAPASPIRWQKHNTRTLFLVEKVPLRAAEAGVDAEVYSSDAFISVLMFARLPIYMPRLIAELSGMKNEKTRIIGCPHCFALLPTAGATAFGQVSVGAYAFA